MQMCITMHLRVKNSGFREIQTTSNISFTSAVSLNFPAPNCVHFIRSMGLVLVCDLTNKISLFWKHFSIQIKHFYQSFSLFLWKRCLIDTPELLTEEMILYCSLSFFTSSALQEVFCDQYLLSNPVNYAMSAKAPSLLCHLKSL